MLGSAEIKTRNWISRFLAHGSSIITLIFRNKRTHLIRCFENCRTLSNVFHFYQSKCSRFAHFVVHRRDLYFWTRRETTVFPAIKIRFNGCSLNHFGMELHRLMVFSIHYCCFYCLWSVCQLRWPKCATNWWHANIAYILHGMITRAEGSWNFVAYSERSQREAQFIHLNQNENAKIDRICDRYFAPFDL